MRIIIDVNLWVSFGMGKSLDRLRSILPHSGIELFACEELNREIAEVIQRPRLKKYLKPERVVELFELLAQFANYVSIENSRTADFQDAKDNYLLDLAESVNADFLVTGDKLLLELQTHKNTQIISFAEIVKKLDSTP